MKSLTSIRASRMRMLATGLGLCGLAAAPAAWAQSSGYETYLELAAGVGCSFPLVIESRGTPNFSKEFLDKNGNVVRLMSAGSQVDYRLTNKDTGLQYVVNGRGAMQKTVPTGNGGSELSLQGHSIIIMFPSDVPAGPSTTSYEGRVVIAIDAQGNYTLRETSGRQADVCAKLSGSPL